MENTTPAGSRKRQKVETNENSLAGKNTRNFAFQIDHILLQILEWATTETVKKFRLVCKRGKRFGGIVLEKKSHINLWFDYSLSKKSVEGKQLEKLLGISVSQKHQFISQYPVLALEQLKLVVCFSDVFPCRSFSLRTKQFNYPHIQSLLKDIGCCMQTLNLKLSATDDDMFMIDLARLLKEQAVNLKHLRISLDANSKSKMLSWEEDWMWYFFEFPERLNFPMLKSFTIENHFVGIACEQILSFSPKLISFSYVPIFTHKLNPLQPFLKYFTSNQENHRIHLLKQINFHPNDDTLPIFEKLVEKNLEFLRLHYFGIVSFPSKYSLVNFWKRVGFVITKILQSSCNSLEMLGIIPLRFIPELVIPVLTKLTSLRIQDCKLALNNSNFESSFFPPNFSIQRIFLKIKSISYNRPLDDEFMLRLETKSPVTTVESLSLWEGESIAISDFTKQKISHIFPNACIPSWLKTSDDQTTFSGSNKDAI